MKLFYGGCSIVGIALILRISPLLPLYLDADVRSNVQQAVTKTAEERGWLLSGVSIKKIDADSVTLQYRSYLRGKDAITTLDVSL